MCADTFAFECKIQFIVFSHFNTSGQHFQTCQQTHESKTVVEHEAAVVGVQSLDPPLVCMLKYH